MGLDMYITAFGYGGEKVGDYKYMENKTLSMYWRKANHIHGWFVSNVQGGADDCEFYVVSQEKMKELHSICLQIISKHKSNEISDDLIMIATKLLPPKEGFFFGGYDVDNYYMQDIQGTLAGLKDILEAMEKGDISFVVYHSSW